MIKIKSEHENLINNDEESIECIDLVSDEEDGSEIMSLQNRKISKSYIIDHQSSQSSSKHDNNVKEELIESSSNDIFYSDRGITNNWTKDDSINLIYIVDNVGRHWKMIADKYKSHLKNQNEEFLHVKYQCLKKNEILFQKLNDMAKLVKDIKIVEASYERKYPIRWSNKEKTYGVLGYKKNGSKWNQTLKDFKGYFHESRSIVDMRNMYKNLKKNSVKLSYFQNKASVLL